MKGFGEMGKDSDQEVIIPTFKMPDLTRSLSEEEALEITKLDAMDRKTAVALGKLTIVLNEVVGHLVLLTEAVRGMRKQQKSQAATEDRVVWYESKLKVALALILTSLLGGIGSKVLSWITSMIHAPKP